jgi:multiple sugar transport system substrate-binding protein
VPVYPGPNRPSRRYLTPFYNLAPGNAAGVALGIALGLVLILAVSACSPKATATPDPTSTTVSQGQVTQRESAGTQALTKAPSTPLPAIPATPDESTPSPLGVTTAQLHGLQVSLWYPWGGATGDSFRSIVDGFNRSNQWGIQVNASGYEDYGSLDDAMGAALEAGTPPDVVVDYGYQARQWDANRALADLTPYLQDPVWGMTGEEQADFYPAFWSEELKAVGNAGAPGRMGIPYYRSAYVLFYNQSWAEELGYPNPPTTPEDFRVRLCAAGEAVGQAGNKTDLGKGGWLVTPNPGELAGWIYAFGGDITNPDGAGYLFDTPATAQAFEFLKSLQDSGCAWMDNKADAQAAFASRQALVVVGSLEGVPSQRSAFATAGSEDNWVVIPFPSDTQPVVVTYGPSLYITSSTTARQLAAWLVIKWLIYPPNQAEFVQEMGVYPTRQSTLRYLIHTEQAGTQWAQALGLLPDVRGEPTMASWSVMRWALSDASSTLFSQTFMADEIPGLLSDLDGMAQEIFDQVH